MLFSLFAVYDFHSYAAYVGIDSVFKHQKAGKRYYYAVRVSFVLWLCTPVLFYGVFKKSYKWIVGFMFMFWSLEVILFILRFSSSPSISLSEKTTSIKYNFYLVGSVFTYIFDSMLFCDLLKTVRRLYVESYKPNAYSRLRGRGRLWKYIVRKSSKRT